MGILRLLVLLVLTIGTSQSHSDIPKSNSSNPNGTKIEDANQVEKKSASDFGVIIIATIVNKNPIVNKFSNENVILIKYIKSGNVKAYRQGSTFDDQYNIETISTDFFTLRRKTPSAKPLLTVYKDSFLTKQAQIETTQKTNVQPASDTFREPGFEREKNAIAMSEDYREKLVHQDLPKILMQASTELAFNEKGEPIGFMIDQIEEGSIFEKGGLKNGDVITSINGNSLEDITVAIKILQSLKKSEEISFEYQRNGETTPVKIDIK